MTTPDTIAPTGQYTTTEACGILGVHRNTLHRYVQRGVLRCSYRRGNGRPFFKGSELIRFTKIIMKLFKKKTATDKALDILTNALHDDEISSFIVMIKKQDSTILSVDGDLFGQVASLVSARRKSTYKRIELLADVMEKAINDEESKDGRESHKDTPGDGEI